jgi:hypothetical protein
MLTDEVRGNRPTFSRDPTGTEPSSSVPSRDDNNGTHHDMYQIVKAVLREHQRPEGNVQAARELVDRTEGKAQLHREIKSSNEGPVEIASTREAPGKTR